MADTPVSDNEDVVVELPAAEPAAEKDPAPEPQAKEPEKPLSEEPDEDELKSYSERVQARIKKMSAQTHAERRKNEALARELNDSVVATRNLYQENVQLKQAMRAGQSYIKDTNKGRIEAQIAQAQAAYKVAFEAGDADTMAATAAEIGKLGAQLDRNEAWQVPPPEQPAPPPQPQPRPQPQVDQKTIDWQDRNQWFGRDDAMTGFALGVHRHLVNVEGIDPRGDEYFRRIDSEMKLRFPEKFGGPTSQPRVSSPVAPASRATAPKPNKVSLSASQVALAKKLGITPQQMAEEVLKLNG